MKKHTDSLPSRVAYAAALFVCLAVFAEILAAAFDGPDLPARIDSDGVQHFTASDRPAK